MLTCKEASRLVSESYDRRLGWRERVGVRVHLLICAACARFARQMRFLREAAKRAAAQGAGPMPGATRRRIENTLRRKAR